MGYLLIIIELLHLLPKVFIDNGRLMPIRSSFKKQTDLQRDPYPFINRIL